MSLQEMIEISHVANYQLLESESGSLHTNRGAAGTITISLPVNADMGIYYRFHVAANKVLRIGANGSIIRYISGLCDSYIWADAIGEYIMLVSNGFGEWYPLGKDGVWTVVFL